MDNQNKDYNNKFENLNSRAEDMVNNFDLDGETISDNSSLENEKSKDNYGDDFDEQTGEDDHQATVFQDISHYQNNSDVKSVKTKNKNIVAIVLVCAAVLILIVAIIFGISSCSDNKTENNISTVQSASIDSSDALATTEFIQENTQAEEEYVETEPVTEAVATEPETEVQQETEIVIETEPQVTVPLETHIDELPTEPIVTEPQPDLNAPVDDDIAVFEHEIDL